MNARASFFNMLGGGSAEERTYAGNEPVDPVVASIITNLDRLLNTRRGTVAHLPDYGIPDLAGVGHRIFLAKFKQPKHDDSVIFERIIEEAVRRYEPRLDKVRVTEVETPKKPGDEDEAKASPYRRQVVFYLTAILVDQQKPEDQQEGLRLITTISSFERARVLPAPPSDS